MAITLFKPGQTSAGGPGRRSETCWTWTDSVRRSLDSVAELVPDMSSPPLIHLRRGEEYDYTYTLKVTGHLPPQLVRSIQSIGRAFLRFDPGSERLMFRDLVERRHPRKLLHVFFSLIRQSMVDETGDPMSAMYAPLGTTGNAAGEFRLHADLYIPRLLFNVFDDVPEDGSGASTFLSVHAFRRVLRDCSELPPSVRLEIQRLFRAKLQEDGYEQFIRLVHDESNPWHASLWRGMEERQEIIPLNRGEGYLLNDRAWLHGRTCPSNRVSRFRVHRLIFGKS